MAINEWWSCDGNGHGEVEAPRTRPIVSRRSFISSVTLGALGWLAASPAMAQLTMSKDGSDHVFVSIFLRGGADGLNIVSPVGEDAYHAKRPTLGLSTKEALDLDGFFGLNPAMASLMPLYKEGQLGLVHACGSQDNTRSHFEAMSSMERGLDGREDGDASGWLARHLINTPPSSTTPLRAVAIGRTMPDSLRGANNSISLGSIADYRLQVSEERHDKVRSKLVELYGDRKDPFGVAGRETLEVLGALKRIDVTHYKPENGAKYPESDLGSALSQVAMLIKAGIGLEVACLDKGGWDTHYGQNLAGLLSGLLKDLADSLTAFHQDMGTSMKRVTVAVQTEFGRRVHENQSLGTDHGRGSVMFVLGGDVRGGKVYGKWPGLRDDQLDEVGDLRVTTDYRDVLAEVMMKQGNHHIDNVFRGLKHEPLGIVS